MTNDEFRLLLLTPQLSKADTTLPDMAWLALHGDDFALVELGQMLDRLERPEAGERALDIVRHARGRG